MRRIQGTVLAATLLLALASIACGRTSAPRTAAPRWGPPPVYRLGVEDLIEIVVWREPGLSTTAPVRPDGRIDVPGVGSLRAAGRTTGELEREIAARLATVISSPLVSVVVKEIGARIYVLGEVSHPGAYRLGGLMTVLQAIALAGGLTEFADGNGIVVLRRDGRGVVRRIGLRWDAAVRGAASLELMAGDTIVVP